VQRGTGMHGVRRSVECGDSPQRRERLHVLCRLHMDGVQYTYSKPSRSPRSIIAASGSVADRHGGPRGHHIGFDARLPGMLLNIARMG
jgi:hypothetical protein